MRKTTQFCLSCMLCMILVLSACTSPEGISEPGTEPGGDSPVEPVEMEDLVGANTAFAFDLHQAVRSLDGNLFYSPYSISLALTMTYAGARGETASQMADALRFSQADGGIHSGFSALNLELASRPEQAAETGAEDPFELSIVNSIWGQEGWPFLPEFLDLLESDYAAGMRLVDYVNDPEAARRMINDWVSEQTNDRIQDLVPAGLLGALTRLVLVNAIYFKAGWMYQFDPDATRDSAFTLLDGSRVDVPMMSFSEPEQLLYASGDGWQAVALPYQGGSTEMIVLLPEEGDFSSIEDNLDASFFDGLVQSLQVRGMTLDMPKFTFTSTFQLSQVLSALGMADAFDPSLADFSGMDGERDLFIDEVLHKAFVAVDEEGTEAAAATAVVMQVTAAMEAELHLSIDRPFFFFILDVPTGSILFMGRVLNPD